MRIKSTNPRGLYREHSPVPIMKSIEMRSATFRLVDAIRIEFASREFSTSFAIALRSIGYLADIGLMLVLRVVSHAVENLGLLARGTIGPEGPIHVSST